MASCGDDVAAKPEVRRALEGPDVSGDDIVEIYASVEQLGGLEVEVLVGRTAVVAVVWLGEEPRGPKDQDGEVAVAVDKLAQVLGGDLRCPVNVARLRDDVLGDPRCRLVRPWGQRPAERARGAGADERLNPGVDGLLKEHKRAADVCLDERLPCVRADVRLVKRGGV